LIISFISPLILAAYQWIAAPEIAYVESKKVRDVFDQLHGPVEYPAFMYELADTYTYTGRFVPDHYTYRKRSLFTFITDAFSENLKSLSAIGVFFILYPLYLLSRSIVWAVSTVSQTPAT
jgi:hypothetical protein